MALILGLGLTVKMKCTHLEIATDSLELTKSIHQNIGIDTNLICMCRNLVQKLGNPVVRHECRNQNGAADLLAKEFQKKTLE